MYGCAPIFGCEEWMYLCVWERARDWEFNDSNALIMFRCWIIVFWVCPSMKLSKNCSYRSICCLLFTLYVVSPLVYLQVRLCQYLITIKCQNEANKSHHLFGMLFHFGTETDDITNVLPKHSPIQCINWNRLDGPLRRNLLYEITRNYRLENSMHQMIEIGYGIALAFAHLMWRPYFTN